MRELLPFIRLLKAHWGWLVLGFILSMITVISVVGLLSLAGWFISAAAFAGLSVVTASQFNYLIPGAMVRAFAYARILGRYSERVVNHEATFRVLVDLRVWFFRSLEPLAPAYLLYHRSGDLLNRAVSDVDALDNLYLRVLAPSLVAFFLLIIVGIFLSFFSVAVALSVIGFLLLASIGIPVVVSRLAMSTGATLVTVSATLRTQMVELIQGLPELLLAGAHTRKLQQLTEDNQNLLQLQQKMSFYQGFSAALMTLMLGLTILVGLFLSVQAMLAGELNGDNLALIALCVLGSFEAIAPLPLAYQYLGKTRKAATRLLQIAHTKPDIIFSAQSKALPRDHTIQLRDVSFTYPDGRAAVQNIELHIAAGEHIAMMGPTGAGKSTLIHLIARFIDPTQGMIEIGGVDHRTLHETALRTIMTVISQKPHLFNATLRDNLLLAKPSASDQELYDALDVVQLLSFIKSLPEGLDTYAGEGGVRFSGGQVRRLALARAILHNAPIWLLDEPTEGLDRATEYALMETLWPLMQNRTVILNTHHKATVQRMDRVVNIQCGSIIGQKSKSGAIPGK